MEAIDCVVYLSNQTVVLQKVKELNSPRSMKWKIAEYFPFESFWKHWLCACARYYGQRFKGYKRRGGELSWKRRSNQEKRMILRN